MEIFVWGSLDKQRISLAVVNDLGEWEKDTIPANSKVLSNFPVSHMSSSKNTSNTKCWVVYSVAQLLREVCGELRDWGLGLLALLNLK